MIKIIKDGQKEFTTKCPTCGCEFSYQLVDIGLGSVTCPCCGGYVATRSLKGRLLSLTHTQFRVQSLNKQQQTGLHQM